MRQVSRTILAAMLAVFLYGVPGTCAADDHDSRTSEGIQGDLDSKTTGDIVRASKLIGMDIQNRKGKSVGGIHDLVIDAGTGQVRYAAVTYGGLLGFGDKLFAVPYEAFRCKADPRNHDQKTLVLDVTQKQLEGAKGFDEYHWPDFADEDFASTLDKRYGVERHSRAGRLGVNVSRSGVEVNVGAKRRSNHDSSYGLDDTVRVSQMMGMNIQNPQGNSVGKVEDLVIDADRGKVRYAAVTYGGFLGLGNKLFAVPYEAFRCKTDPNDHDDRHLILDVTQQQLNGATGFDEKRWPNFGDREFTDELDKRYGIDSRERDGHVGVSVGRGGISVNVDRN